MFPMIFQSLMGLGKSRCDVLSGPPKDVFAPCANTSKCKVAHYLLLRKCSVNIIHANL